MCENCKKSNDSFEEILKRNPLPKIFGLDNLFGVPGIAPLGMEEFEKAMRSFHKKYDRIPSPKELVQFILSSKANPKSQDSSTESPIPHFLELLEKMSKSCEGCNECDADPDPSDRSEEPKSNCDSKPIVEVSYEAMVDHASIEIKAF